jgi:hypothetical protein
MISQDNKRSRADFTFQKTNYGMVDRENYRVLAIGLAVLDELHTLTVASISLEKVQAKATLKTPYRVSNGSIRVTRNSRDATNRWRLEGL